MGSDLGAQARGMAGILTDDREVEAALERWGDRQGCLNVKLRSRKWG